MSATRRTSRLTEVSKNPAAYVLIALAGLVGFLVRSDGKEGTRTADCLEQVSYLRREASRKDSAVQSLTRELLIANGVIDELPRAVDSTLTAQ